MEALTFEKNLRRLIQICYKMYHVPFAWSSKENRFFIDKSVKVKVISRLVFLLDIFCAFFSLGCALRNTLAGLSYKFTLVLLFLFVGVIENIVLDYNFIVNQTVTAQLLNAACSLLRLKKGIKLFK